MKKKILLLLCSFVVIYLVNFTIPRLMPGDPFDYQSAAAGEESSTEMTEELKEYLRAYYGLDKPFFAQLWQNIKNNLRGDLGYSIHYKHPVSELLMERLPWTAFIMFTTLALSLILGTALALLGLRRKKADGCLYALFSVLWELPHFLVGILLLFLVAARVDWIPLSGAVTAFGIYYSEWDWIGDVLLHALMPIAALTLVTIPGFYFTARASFISIIERPYVLAARAKGLREGRIRLHYVFRNALPPIVARFFLSVGAAIGGTMLIENVFAYPGLGTVMREAVKYRDYPLIQGVFLLSTVLVLMSLFIADMINDINDRRKGGSL